MNVSNARHNKGFRWVLSQLIPFLSEQIQQNNKRYKLQATLAIIRGIASNRQWGLEADEA